MKTLHVALIAAALACAGPALADKKDKGFSKSEREEISRYYESNPEKRKQLPPGLAKKNKLPPGWQKKLAKGDRIPDDVWAHRVELPKEIKVAEEKGTIRVRIDDRVVKVAERTREVLDIVEIVRNPQPR